ncbi:MAG: SLC13 family permease, partial [Candidatus Omnitrophota bacterium]
MIKQLLFHGGSLFMGSAPAWYKNLIVFFLAGNAMLYFYAGSYLAGWAVLVEFLLVLAMSLKAYPLFPGGLLALEVLLLNMTSSAQVMREVTHNIDVLMLLMFMVPAIYFMQPLLAWIFMKLFAAIRNKVALSLVFLVSGAFLSAWLDALTVLAVMIIVCVAVRKIYVSVDLTSEKDAEDFNGFLRNLLMHGAMGTAIGGVATLIGEPQNILIAKYAGWNFKDFYTKMAHFSIPVQIAGIMLCFGLEFWRVRMFGFGYRISDRVAAAIEAKSAALLSRNDAAHPVRMGIMLVALLCLMMALAFQLAPIGIVGLGLLITLPVLTGQMNEHEMGKSFGESMPFAALLVVFFVIVAMIESLGLFEPITHMALQFEGKGQLYAFFFASGILSAVSDNVFV